MKHICDRSDLRLFVAVMAIIMLLGTLGGCRKTSPIEAQRTKPPVAQPKVVKPVLRFEQMQEAVAIYSIFQDGERLRLYGLDVDALEYEDASAAKTICVPLRASLQRGGKTVGYTKLNAHQAYVLMDNRVLDVPLLIVEQHAYTDQLNFERATGWNFNAAKSPQEQIGIADILTVQAKSKAVQQ